MTSQTTTSRILTLLIPTIIVAIGDSYVPHELNLVRQLLSFVLFALMAIIMVVAVRAVIDDF